MCFHYGTDDEVSLLVCELRIDRQRNLVGVIAVSLRIVFDVIALLAEKRKHRQRYEVHVYCHFRLCYLLNNFVALLLCHVLYAKGVDVVRAFLARSNCRRSERPTLLLQSVVITCEDTLTFFEKIIVLAYLC